MIKRKMKKFTAMALVVAMTFSMAGCEKSKNSNSAKKEQAKFDTYLQESFEESVTSDTVTLHYTLAHPENHGITMEEVTLGEIDFSEEALAEDKKEVEDEIKELKAFDYDLLTEDQQLTYDIMLDLLETNLLSYDNPYLYEPFAYTSGLQSNLPITMSEYTFYDEDDVKDYITLLNQIPDYYQACLDFEKTKSEKGFFMNDTSADEVIRQCEEYIADPENNLLIATFNDRIGEVPGMTPEKAEEYKKQNYDAVMNSVIPAYQNVIDTFKALKGTGTNELGLVHYEGGKEYYQYLIKSKVGTDKTPDEMIEKLETEIENVMGELYGLAMVNSEAYMGWMEDYTSFYQDLDTVETIRYFEEMTVDKFPDIPDINFTVDPVHESLEGIVSPAFFMTPPMDDYENNSIYINEGSDASNTLWSTLAHEGIPGHMYQFVYFLSNDPEPIRTLLSFNGYQEGWATYVELMSYDYYEGYSNEAYGDIEAINTKLNLLLMARIEIGVNYEGWSLEDTSDYLTNSGFDGSAAKDVFDYVVAEPANYQMYVMSWLEIEELRDYAEEKLGDKFNEVEFHKVILDAGPCQFYILEELVEDYVKEAK